MAPGERWLIRGAALLLIAAAALPYRQASSPPEEPLRPVQIALAPGEPAMTDALGDPRSVPFPIGTADDAGAWACAWQPDWITTPYGSHRRGELTWAGLPVFDATLILHRDRAGHLCGLTLPSCMRSDTSGQPALPRLPRPATAAGATALRVPAAPETAGDLAGDWRAAACWNGAALQAPPRITRGWLLTADGPRLLHRVTATADRPRRDLLRMVEGPHATPLVARDLLCHARGSGLVFRPNPVVTAGNPDLRDGDDVDPYREAVLLEELDASGFLHGRWVRVENPGGEAFHPDLRYDYSARDLHFEEVMAYYHITTARQALTALGYATLGLGVQEVRVHATADDDSWFSPLTGRIALGDGGVDDGEDADVILHEFGHAIFHAIVGAASTDEAVAVNEGFADYWAASLTGGARIGDWDGAGLPGGCRRDLSRPHRYPEDMRGEPHHDGQIWGGVLWRLREALGASLADRLAVETLFYLTGRADLHAAARALEWAATAVQAIENDPRLPEAIAAVLSAAGLAGVSAPVPLPARTLRITPAPAGPGAALEFSVERAGRYAVSLLDASGRCLAPAQPLELGAGHHTWPLARLLSAHGPLPSGCYLVCLRGPQGLRTGRLLWVR